MTRTGSRGVTWLTSLAVGLLAPSLALAAAKIDQQVDRTELSLDDTFTLMVVITDAPEGSEVELPASGELEVLQRMQSTQRSYSVGPRGGRLETVERYTLVMRPLRAGRVIVPATRLRTRGGPVTGTPVILRVSRGSGGGSATPPSGKAVPDDPVDDLQDPLEDLLRPPGLRIPRSDSDLFLRAHLDKLEAYVGEQVTYSLYLYARVDLSSVDGVTLPKLDGFWSEEVDGPNQLRGETQNLDGVLYRVYLLKRRALFPTRAGKVEIAPAAADVTTGFLFSGRRLNRRGNAVGLTVKAAPSGAPGDFRPEQVGHWKLKAELDSKEVELGQPANLRVTLEGTGNLRRMTLPRLPAVEGLKVYDPTTEESFSDARARIGGRRTHQYLIMAQRTGTFTLPALRFSFLDPRTGRYEVTQSSPLQLTVRPAHEKAPLTPGAMSVGTGQTKNVLSAGVLRPVRHQAVFAAPAPAPWTRMGFGLTLAVPFGTWAVLALVDGFRNRPGKSSPEMTSRRKARQVRERLARAQKLREAPGDAFFGELERAVMASLELKLRIPVGGLTRPELLRRLTEAGFADEGQRALLSVLEACESGRYAPGAGSASREQVLRDAEVVIAGASA